MTLSQFGCKVLTDNALHGASVEGAFVRLLLEKLEHQRFEPYGAINAQLAQPLRRRVQMLVPDLRKIGGP